MGGRAAWLSNWQIKKERETEQEGISFFHCHTQSNKYSSFCSPKEPLLLSLLHAIKPLTDPQMISQQTKSSQDAVPAVLITTRLRGGVKKDMGYLGREGKREEGGVCSSSIVPLTDSPGGLKGAPVKRYPSSYQMAKPERKKEGSRWMNCGATARANLVTRKRAEERNGQMPTAGFSEGGSGNRVNEERALASRSLLPSSQIGQETIRAAVFLLALNEANETKKDD